MKSARLAMGHFVLDDVAEIGKFFELAVRQVV